MSEPDRSVNVKPDSLTLYDTNSVAFEKQSTSSLQEMSRLDVSASQGRSSEQDYSCARGGDSSHGPSPY